MNEEISKLKKMIFDPLDLEISQYHNDLECEDYFGFNFKINELKIKYRQSKHTPKKIGQFVTYWKRNLEGKTVPFDINDDFDFYLIHIIDEKNFGMFMFSKQILEKEHLISSLTQPGKRGFRVYADWHYPTNKQAEKTKLWQCQYFIDLTEINSNTLERFKKMSSL